MGLAPSCTAQEQCHPQCNLDLPSPKETTIFDVYEIGNILGSGAFGQVRACWPSSREDDHLYAVKIIDTREVPTHVLSIEESEILQPLEHRHIVALHETYEHDHMLFLIQERVTGGELFAAFADKQNRVDEQCVSFVGRQLLQALQYLHDRLIVHRDIKAENVLLKSRPSESQEWHVKLIDFGLAIRMESDGMIFRACQQPEMLSEEIICGTLYYCAPEVFANTYGPKVDVWAVGVMMYLALFGLYPFYDRDPDAMEALICDREVEPQWETALAAAYPEYEVSETSQEALSALLEKEYLERPSAREALEDPWYQTTQSMDDIPIAIRTKAYRAAVKASVNISKEQARTASIVALKQKMRNEAYPDSPHNFPKEVGGQARRFGTFPLAEKDDAVEVVDLEAAMRKFKHIEAVTAASAEPRMARTIQAA